jgi:hypothetical protein
MVNAMKPRFCLAVLFLAMLVSSPMAGAQMSPSEREQARSMIAGTLYLRLDVPCRYGRGRFGIAASIHHVESILEVSPTGYSVDRKMALPPQYRRAVVFWGFSPNDPVRYGKLLFKGDTVQVWMEGDAPHDYEILLDFIHIQNLADFTKAFNLAFSKVPLQDEHPEWPADVRQAVAGHKLTAGMTPAQAFSVVGKPLQIEDTVESGQKVETWFPRQDRSTVPNDRTPTGFPARLKFSSGVLQTIDPATPSADSGAR